MSKKRKTMGVWIKIAKPERLRIKIKHAVERQELKELEGVGND